MNYFTGDYLIKLQGEVIDFIEKNFTDCIGYADFIELVANKDTSKELILNEIDRDYLNNFIAYKKSYTSLNGEDELNEILNDEYINYFMDCNLTSLLDYFTEITFIELLSYVDIYKYNDMFYATWEI